MTTMIFTYSHRTCLTMAIKRLSLDVLALALSLGVIACGSGGSSKEATKTDSSGVGHVNEGGTGEVDADGHAEDEHAEGGHAGVGEFGATCSLTPCSYS